MAQFPDDPLAYGSYSNPVRQDMFEYIIEVHWPKPKGKPGGPPAGAAAADLFGPEFMPSIFIGPNADVPFAPIVGGFEWTPCEIVLTAIGGDVNFDPAFPESFAIPRSGFWSAHASLEVSAAYGDIKQLQIGFRDANESHAGAMLAEGSPIDIEYQASAACTVDAGLSGVPAGPGAFFVSVWGLCETCPDASFAGIIGGDRVGGIVTVTHFALSDPPAS